MLPCMNALGRAAEGCAEPRERTGSGIFEGAFVRRVAERAVREYNRRMVEMGRDANLAGGAFPASRGHAEGTHAANKPEAPKDARTPKDGHAPAPSQEPEQRDRGRSEGGTKH